MSEVESWVYLKDGVLMLHVENDGYSYLRRGREAYDKPITLAELEGSPLLHEARQLLQPGGAGARQCRQ
jgi:hypothetical protein